MPCLLGKTLGQDSLTGRDGLLPQGHFRTTGRGQIDGVGQTLLADQQASGVENRQRARLGDGPF